MQVGDVVSWGESSNKALGRILSIHTKGNIELPDSSQTFLATEDNPFVLLAPLTQSDVTVGKYLKAATDKNHPSEMDPDPPKGKATPAAAAEEPPPALLPPLPDGVNADAMATFFILMAMSLLEDA